MITFEYGKKKRAELRLPLQHFIVIDDWLGKLGENAYLGWLKFYTWADRSAPDREADIIPMGMKKVAERLGCSEPTLYKTIIRPLWNYGLIDIKEVMMHRTPHKNIIVYEYPQNDPTLATKPLEKIRDYDTDYSSTSRVYGRKGGKKQKGGLKKFKVIGLKKFKPLAKKILSPPLKKILANNDIEYLSNVMNNSSNDQKKEYNGQSIRVPDRIKKAVERNGLIDRLTDIALVYEIFSGQPGFSDPLMIMTLSKPAVKKKADADPGAFYRYLTSAIQNNIQQNAPTRVAPPMPVSSVFMDKLPASVLEQREWEAKQEVKHDSGNTRTVWDDPDLREKLMALRQK